MVKEPEKLASIVESLLFVAEKPLTKKKLREVLQLKDAELLNQAFELLRASYESPLRGVALAEVGGGYQLRTVSDNAPWVLKLNEAKPQRLSRAALETLAIISYKQPLTRPEIEEIRGVDCGGVLRTLLERELIKILGKKEEPGNPLIYGTTDFFLSFFGIKSLKELPSLKEYSELQEAQQDLPLEDFTESATVAGVEIIEEGDEPDTTPPNM